jgi:hypothetical protein
MDVAPNMFINEINDHYKLIKTKTYLFCLHMLPRFGPCLLLSQVVHKGFSFWIVVWISAFIGYTFSFSFFISLVGALGSLGRHLLVIPFIDF